jgi:hypothetical protein
VTDEQYIFKNESREKRQIANSARKKHGCKKGCRLPSDNLTKKQMEEMNGVVKTYNLEKQMTWENFRKMPMDIQKEYVTNMMEKHGARKVDLAKMLGASEGSFMQYSHNHFPEIKIEKRKKTVDPRWEAFMSRKESNIEKSEDTTVSKEKEGENKAEVKEATDKAPCSKSVECRGLLTFKGTPADIFTKTMMVIDNRKEYEIQIMFKEANNA